MATWILEWNQNQPEGVQGDGIPVLDGHLHSLEVSVHGHIHPSDGAMHLAWDNTNMLHNTVFCSKSVNFVGMNTNYNKVTALLD